MQYNQRIQGNNLLRPFYKFLDHTASMSDLLLGAVKKHEPDRIRRASQPWCGFARIGPLFLVFWLCLYLFWKNYVAMILNEPAEDELCQHTFALLLSRLPDLARFSTPSSFGLSAFFLSSVRFRLGCTLNINKYSMLIQHRKRASPNIRIKKMQVRLSCITASKMDPFVEAAAATVTCTITTTYSESHPKHL